MGYNTMATLASTLLSQVVPLTSHRAIGLRAAGAVLLLTAYCNAGNGLLPHLASGNS